MTLLRKIIIVLVGLSLAILVSVLLLDPNSIAAMALSLGATSALIRLPLAILIDILVLAVLVILVRETRSAHSSSGLMVKAQGAIADVSVESATDRILRAVRAVPEVLSATANVKAVHGKADVDLDVIVSRQSKSLPDKQKEIDRALRQVINKELGLQMSGKPRVHIRMDDEANVNKLPDSAPVVAPLPGGTPVATETIIEPEDQGERPMKVETLSYKDSMSLRGETKVADDDPNAHTGEDSPASLVEPASGETTNEEKIST